MFSFQGRLTRWRFLTGAAIRIVLFAATIIGFPFILWAIGKATNCASVGGACGAVALTASMALKPVFFFIFVFSLIGISLRRARDTGLPASLGLIVPLLALGDISIGSLAGAHWSHAFAVGVLRPLPFPWFWLLALCAIVVLGVLPSRDSTGATPRTGRWAGLAARPPPFPLWILPTGALLAVAAIVVSQPNNKTGMMILMMMITSAGVPTFVVYSAALYGIWCVIQRRDRVAVGVLAVTLLPFDWWLYATISDQVSLKREADAIGAIKTEGLAHVPNVLVFQSSAVDGFFALHGVHGITEVIADGPYGASERSPTPDKENAVRAARQFCPRSRTCRQSTCCSR